MIDRYDTGLLGDGGGGNVEWWWDYIRAELERAHEFYVSQIEHLTSAGEGAVPAGCNPNAIARIRSIADTLDSARAIQDPDWAFLHGVADAIAKIAAPHPTRQDGAMCQTCQGNGEIVTDWDRYMKGNTDANGDEAVAECPDCNGSGKVSQDGARGGETLTFVYRNWRGEVAERKVIPLSVHYGATEWHPEPQWLMRAFDLDKQAERDFAMADMSPATTPPAPDEAVEAEREACAQLLEQMASGQSKAVPGHWHSFDAGNTLRDGAKAIRSRSRRDGGRWGMSRQRENIERQARLIVALAETMEDRMWATDILVRLSQIETAVEEIRRIATSRLGGER